MADLSITAANVDYVSGPLAKVRFGATVTRGKVVYYDSADGEWKLQDGNGSTTTPTNVNNCGIAMTDGTDGKMGLIAKNGARINIGATAVAGVSYSATSTDVGTANGTAGGICASSALGSGDRNFHLFTGEGTGLVTLAFDAPAAALA